jgi:hypothetical protein
MDDTSPAARKRYFELLAQQTPADKLAMCARLTRATRTMALAGLREQHPDATDAELARLLAVRIYGDAAPRGLLAR